MVNMTVTRNPINTKQTNKHRKTFSQDISVIMDNSFDEAESDPSL